MAEDTAVRVGTVNCIMSLELRDPHEEVVHQILLVPTILYFILEVFSEDAEDTLEEQESVEVFISPARGIVEDSDALVLQHLILHVNHARSKLGSLQVQNVDASIGSL